MRFRKSLSQYWILYLLFISWLFMPKLANLILLLIVSLYLMWQNQFKVFNDFPGKKIYFIMLILGVVVGIINLNSSNHNAYALFKHTYYFVIPFLYWNIGSFIARKKLERQEIIEGLINVVCLYSIYDVIFSSSKIITGSYYSIHQLRALIGNGSFLPVLGVYLLIFYKKEIYKTKLFQNTCLFFAVVSLLIHFSRTYILEMVILLLFSGVIKNWKKFLQIVLGLTIIVIGFYVVMPDFVKLFIEKLVYSLTEVSTKTTTWDYVAINNNWRGYEFYCEIKHFLNANVTEQVFGGGFGSTLDTFGYSYLVSNEETLVFLHNGYGTQLMIWGLNGIALFIIWLVQLYKSSKRCLNNQDKRLIKGFTVIIAIVTSIIMGPFFSEGVAVYLMIMALFVNGKNVKTVQRG